MGAALQGQVGTQQPKRLVSSVALPVAAPVVRMITDVPVVAVTTATFPLSEVRPFDRDQGALVRAGVGTARILVWALSRLRALACGILGRWYACGQ